MKQTATNHLNEPIREQGPNDLRLVLLDNIRQHKLSLIRTDRYPSRTEIKNVRESFAIPPNATQERDRRQHQGQIFYIVRLTWPRQGKMKMLSEKNDKVTIAFE